jgi:hypothetical protein
MRLVLPLLLALTAVLTSSPGDAQSPIPADVDGQGSGPNARAAHRPMGPNALAARRPLGPNGALAERARRAAGNGPYPSCTAAGAERAVPIRRGEPGYARHLDRDGDGVACD